MKILLLSDSHYKTIYNFDLELYDLVIHTGDIKMNDYDLIQLENNIKYVSGNCDYFSKDDLIKEFIFNNKRYFICHSHTFHTKEGLSNLINMTKNNYDYVIYGHTHIQNIIKEGSTYYINPGSYQEGSYAEIIDNCLYFYNKKNIFSRKENYKITKKILLD